MFEIAVESGAEDIEDVQDRAIIQTSYSDLSSVRERLIEKGVTPEEVEAIRKPLNPIAISDPAKLERIIHFLNKLEELDDVQKSLLKSGAELKKKNNFLFNIPKRQKFIITVIILSLSLFFSEQLFGRGGIYIAFFLSLFTGLFVYWTEREDLKDNFSPQVFKCNYSKSY